MQIQLKTHRSTSAFAAMLLVGGLVGTAQAQNVFDDFSSGNDNAWLRVDGPAFTFGRPSSYSVIDGAYRIGTPADSAGISAYSFRTESVAVDSQISVDILNWNPDVGTSAAITARAFQNAQGGLEYYTLAFLSKSRTYPGLSNLGIYRASRDGTLYALTGNHPFAQATAGQSYRMIMTLTGATITGEIFDLATGVSLSSQSYTDSSSLAILGPGAAGLSTATFTPTGNEPTYATFDNFRVVPAPGAAALIAMGGLLAARRRRVA